MNLPTLMDIEGTLQKGPLLDDEKQPSRAIVYDCNVVVWGHIVLDCPQDQSIK